MASFEVDATPPLGYQMAVQQSLDQAQPVTHLGVGTAQVYKVASNRSILGPDGKVRATRYTATKDPALRAEPEGLVDPNPDYPGIARFMRQLAVPDALHIHFAGAGGNIGAGKYNDGSHENRLILAERLADGMKRAWESSKRTPITAASVDWTIEPVAIPPDTLKEANLKSDYVRRYKTHKKIDIECLTLGNTHVLFMPGELFVEYQLAAKAMRPDLFVAMAAYGDYGPGYIPTAAAFKRGGYEAGVSKLLPETENILMTAMRKLLKEIP